MTSTAVTVHTPNPTPRRAGSMAPRRLGALLSRLVLVTALVAALAVGSLATRGPSEAAARPMSCETAMNIAWGYLDMAHTYYNLGYMNLYYYYYGKYEGLADAHYPC